MKKLLLSCLLLCTNLLANAQATDFVVDCQTPGWLSSYISPNDINNIRNLKVLGVINQTDLATIGNLVKNYNLHGRLDLGEVAIVGDKLTGEMFGVKGCQLDCFITPKEVGELKGCCDWVTLDTLIAGGPANPDFTFFTGDANMNLAVEGEYFSFTTNYFNAKHLILHEGTLSLSMNGYSSYGFNGPLESITCPESMKAIYNISNFKNLISLTIPDNIEYLGSRIKTGLRVDADTLFVPNPVKTFDDRWAYDDGYFEAYQGGGRIKCLYLPEGLDNFYISYGCLHYGAKVDIHIKRKTPPNVPDGHFKTPTVIYVPVGCKDVYSNQWAWAEATIIEEVYAEKIDVTIPEVFHTGDSQQLIAEFTPNNTTFKEVTWISSNNDIFSISPDGMSTAHQNGTVQMSAINADHSCEFNRTIKIYDHTTGVSISDYSIKLNVGGKATIIGNTLPLDTSDGMMIWESDDEMVATVDQNGNVRAVGRGICNISVTSVDGGYTAVCEVIVKQPVEALVLEKHSMSLKVGETEKLFAQISPSTASDKTVEWSSSNEQLATVDANGKVTAIKAGEVWVKAVSKDNEEAKDSCKVTVIQPVSSVNLSKTNVELNNIGESIQLEAVVLPEDASDKSVTWKSSNEQVCSVSNNGLVSATGAGNAIVTVTTTDGGHTVNCLVKVIQHVTGLTMEKHSTSLKVGENEQLKAVVSPDNADDKSVEWSSSNEQLATVDANGNVTAIKAGEVWVKVVSKDNEEAKDSCKVTVIQPVTGITLVQTNVELNAISENIQLEVVIMPEDASDKSVTWKSSNEQVCVVSPSGLLTATGAGSAVVTVTTVDGGFSATCVVKVIQHVNSLSLDRTAMELKVAETDRLVATVLPDNSDDKTVLWDSSNEQIATVDANGNVTAITTGEVWVKAVSKDNAEAKDSCKVTVIQPVTGITLSESNITFNNVGETKQLVATVEPENASNKDVIWSSSNENVCIVNNGMVTAVSAGTTTVTATTVDGNFAATCIVKVVQHVTKVELNNYTLSLKVGETGRLTATISPDNAENKSVNWFSSDEQVATVDANGNVTAIKAGETWINVVSKDNAEAKDSCKITVIQPVTGIVLSQESYHLTNIGETIQLEATVLPDDASNKEVKWNSSNENICMVSNGKVVAMGYGNAVIIATTIDGGFMASCAIIVEKELIPVTSITLSQTSVTLAKGESLQLTATVLPSDATNKTLIWKSSDENVCVTTQTGMIIAVNEGTAVITVVPESGVGQAQCNVIVNSEVNAIREINKAEKTPEQIYDMMGRKVDRVVKGRMYIRNGQKFIAK